MVHPSEEVSFSKLIKLYDLDSEECINSVERLPSFHERPELIHLFTVPDSSYREVLDRILKLRERDKR